MSDQLVPPNAFIDTLSKLQKLLTFVFGSQHNNGVCEAFEKKQNGTYSLGHQNHASKKEERTSAGVCCFVSPSSSSEKMQLNTSIWRSVESILCK